MRPIPEKMREKIAADPFMKVCCITGELNPSWEHCWEFGKKGQINEPWAIVPLRRDLNKAPMDIEIKERCRLISLNRATEEDLAKYPKKPWKQIHNYLKQKYGNKNTISSPAEDKRIRQGSGGHL